MDYLLNKIYITIQIPSDPFIDYLLVNHLPVNHCRNQESIGHSCGYQGVKPERVGQLVLCLFYKG